MYKNTRLESIGNEPIGRSISNLLKNGHCKILKDNPLYSGPSNYFPPERIECSNERVKHVYGISRIGYKTNIIKEVISGVYYVNENADNQIYERITKEINKKIGVINKDISFPNNQCRYSRWGKGSIAIELAIKHDNSNTNNEVLNLLIYHKAAENRLEHYGGRKGPYLEMYCER